jgi:multiple sugar transport system permease protein
MKTSTKDTAKAYCFLLPNFMGVLLFVVGPVLASLALSFFRWDIVSWPPQFVGLDNFRMLIQDTRFWQYCGNTAFLMLGMPVGILGSLGLALLLDQKFRGMTWYKIVYFLPSITTGIGIFILWRWIYNADYDYDPLPRRSARDFV